MAYWELFHYYLLALTAAILSLLFCCEPDPNAEEEEERQKEEQRKQKKGEEEKDGAESGKNGKGTLQDDRDREDDRNRGDDEQNANLESAENILFRGIDNTEEDEAELTEEQIDAISKLQHQKRIVVQVNDVLDSSRTDARDFYLQEKKWNQRVSSISKQITEESEGNIRAVNNLFLDRLINVRGKDKPIAVFVVPKSSSLSHGGCYIYDTRRVKDNTLYLFAGTECPDSLIHHGEDLIALMNANQPAKEIVHVIRDYKTAEFKRMIHEIGGHIDQLQSVTNAGDEFFFQHHFYKILLNVKSFSNGEESYIKFRRQATFEELPSKGACVIDTSDLALYLYIPNPRSQDLDELDDISTACKWMGKKKEYKGREVTIFSSENVPPNIAIIFTLST